MTVDLHLCQHTAVSLGSVAFGCPSLPKITLWESRDSSHPTPSRRRQEQPPAKTVLSAASRKAGHGVLNCCQCALLGNRKVAPKKQEPGVALRVLPSLAGHAPSSLRPPAIVVNTALLISKSGCTLRGSFLSLLLVSRSKAQESRFLADPIATHPASGSTDANPELGFFFRV